MLINQKIKETKANTAASQRQARTRLPMFDLMSTSFRSWLIAPLMIGNMTET